MRNALTTVQSLAELVTSLEVPNNVEGDASVAEHYQDYWQGKCDEGVEQNVVSEDGCGFYDLVKYYLNYLILAIVFTK